MAHAGGGGRGAYCSCRALRDAFRAVLGCPDLTARYCLESWGPKNALRGALFNAEGILRSAVPEEREDRLRRLMRRIVERGGGLRYRTRATIVTAMKTGYPGAMAEVLSLLSALPADPQHGLAASLGPYVADLCACLVGDHGWYSADVARLLVGAVRGATRSGPHYSTWTKALREASAQGQAGALEGLLSFPLPSSWLDTPLHYAAKHPARGRVIQMLLSRGATPNTLTLCNACYAGHPVPVVAIAHAMRRAGGLDQVSADRALRAVTDGGAGMVQPLERAASAARLVSELGADPTAALPGACARAAARRSFVAESGEEVSAAEVNGRLEAEVLADQLVCVGADPDAALAALCSTPSPLLAPPPWYGAAMHGAAQHGAAGPGEQERRALAMLLSMGVETRAGAAAALRQALVVPGAEPLALELLRSGAVAAEDCAAILEEVVRGEGSGR
ncbi:hypothetical protein GPECTOR_1g445 [Gonium pectorale]|uniref:Uncharacterized protein n=1 Tax=Gonium pectorale TaxID=33097 RepID=A0A150H2U1_GONPE|nr:hypothetical protein GPECTOR_1g445 [Gonium pectorale]|eukprot:KXZ56497.1 hypothetical protein GPECTOR_1g445 [Gonium pectorale]